MIMSTESGKTFKARNNEKYEEEKRRREWEIETYPDHPRLHEKSYTAHFASLTRLSSAKPLLPFRKLMTAKGASRGATWRLMAERRVITAQPHLWLSWNYPTTWSGPLAAILGRDQKGWTLGWRRRGEGKDEWKWNERERECWKVGIGKELGKRTRIGDSERNREQGINMMEKRNNKAWWTAKEKKKRDEREMQSERKGRKPDEKRERRWELVKEREMEKSEERKKIDLKEKGRMKTISEEKWERMEKR